METDPDQEVEGAWRVIISHLLGGETDDDLKNHVRDSLQHRASQIGDILKQDNPLGEKMKKIDSLEVNDVEKEARRTVTGEAKTYHCPVQLKALRTIWASVDNIFWYGTLFKDILVGDGLLSDDGERSISDKTSRNERNVAIWNYLLGLSREDLVAKVIPTLRETHHGHVADEFLHALDQKDSGEMLTTEDIMDLINPRRISNILYTEGDITERTHALLTSTKTSSGEKNETLKKVPWVNFVKALKTAYPHFYELCVEGRSSRELIEAGDIEDDGDDDVYDVNSASSANNDDDADNIEIDYAIAAVKDEQDLKRRKTEVAASRNPDCPWCFCGKCRTMQRKVEELCCIKEVGNDCLSKENIMLALTAGARMLKTELKGTMPETELHSLLRRCHYRLLSVWQYGQLGPKIRKPLPSCCVWKIRDTIPDPKGEYTGFEESSVKIQLSLC